MDWRQIRAVVFDMDGTLYCQSTVRLRMLVRLLRHGMSGRWRDVVALFSYRRNMEQNSRRRVPVLSTRFKAAAARTCLSEDYVAALVHEWMEVRPLDLVSKAAFRDVDRAFDALRKKNIKIGIYSDYPVTDKIAALRLNPDAWCSSMDSDVGCLKPETAGLHKAMSLLGASSADSIMVGDRMDRDYACAASAGVPFLLRKDRDFFSNLANCVERT